MHLLEGGRMRRVVDGHERARGGSCDCNGGPVVGGGETGWNRRSQLVDMPAISRDSHFHDERTA